MGQFERKFQGKRGRQKRVRGLSRGVVCVILSFAVLTIPAGVNVRGGDSLDGHSYSQSINMHGISIFAPRRQI